MPRRSLKPQLNQIRAWVHQGRTDAWIAHQLEVTATELREFRKQYDLSPDDEIEAEIEAATEAEEAEEAEKPDSESDEDDEEREERSQGGSEGEPGSGRRRRRRRGRRGGRGRRKEIEATFDHGESDGYGLWLDAAIKDNPVYTEHWAGKRDVTVRIEADQIVIRRAGAAENGDGGGDDDSDESDD